MNRSELVVTLMFVLFLAPSEMLAAQSTRPDAGPKCRQRTRRMGRQDRRAGGSGG